MPQRRYLILKLPAARIGDRTPGLKADILGGVRSMRLGAEPFFEGGASISTASAEEVDEMGPPEPGEHRLGMPPEMPVRLVPQVTSDRPDTPPGEPWGVERVGAMRSACTGAGVCVGILDTGIDPSHPAFHGLVAPTGAQNYRDFTHTDLTDRSGHGTHCAGIIFGRDLPDGTRIGVAPGVTKVLVAKVFDASGQSSVGQIVDALFWALQAGANVVSLSLGLDFVGRARQLEEGGLPRDLVISRALSDYRDSVRAFDALMLGVARGAVAGRGALVIAAAGNDSHADVDSEYRISASLPAAALDVVAVGAAERAEGGRLRISPYSNADPTLCAPGFRILSAAPGGGTATMTGTSQAAPHVAGVAALWWEAVRREGSWATPELVRARLVGRASPDDFDTSTRPRDRGAGMVIAP